MDSDFWCIANFSGSHSTGTLHFFPIDETHRLQLLLIPRPLSLSSKNTATTKPEI